MGQDLENEQDQEEGVSRRSFLEKALIATGVVSATVIAGTSAMVIGNTRSSAEESASDSAQVGGHDMSSMAPDTAVEAASTTESAEDMDAMHKQGVEDFLKNQKTPITKGKGNVPLQPAIEGGVKVFRLTCDEFEWEMAPSKKASARGYNGAVPGPILRATEGETVRVIVKNNLKESTSVHWHGLYVPNSMDGVPYINQDPIKPGETFTYEFTLRNAGTHMYHSHHNSLDQVNRGLLGAFIVDPKDRASYPAYDVEHIMVLNDLSLGFTINGKGFPATDAVVAKKGQKVLVRFLNEGVMNHPMHLHGMPMQIIAKDGWPMTPPQMCDTIDVAPGNRYDALIDASEAGVWAFHCHVLSHAEGPQGMFGLVTAMVVE